MIELITDKPHPMHLVDSLCDPQLFATLAKTSPLIFITNSTLEILVLPPLLETARSLGFSVEILIIPEGEQAKTETTFLYLHKQLATLTIPRQATLIGVGGGVVLDIVGFVASTHCRGMPFIAVPTTLVAMIDASIGGKNGINLDHIKNRIGSFYLPKDVWICPSVLSSLPEQEFYHGIAECIKHAYIADASILPILQNPASLRSTKQLSLLIKRNCLCKASIVGKDIRDHGIRQILNFGHTLGHALEMLFTGKISHGFAISVGMVLETKLSLAMGVARNPNILHFLVQDLLRYQLPTSLKDLYAQAQIPIHSCSQILSALSYDKKKQNASLPPFVMIEEIGLAASCNGSFCQPASNHFLTHILKEDLHAMHDH
ncbi:3-dehydroquinate synthase [Chlamydia trachomatis]|uniref:3-dehydroquinate synthase n=2 Tax=Chlamydia muridarum TaxID=83560 RepID=AROB_CHLMU|nr:3-dehydroquinate synthase [Chlamydia muridarum]Q9PK25.1 RecName: Full=3-dehydroquinate synthase; Short=DHQS [Chlamydia muridarum str. Nigg]UFT44036.1 3-dehydroquinate synthase [Chlamydia trachomatis]AAF73582.1 3-dehydroquinate synthase [Chlamydia muridarum str. Nigg]AHH23034.1 3-dehydroquinate synthase [Chlamydia muridarum str. Nigg3 CMUT3-5]AHH23959.1 3-dehydroquinate synthase [Chlamydia muridarum str. Nigg CM972]AID38166.1 3-dehydroquinate synthase [Chlamydia muridarum str. Nigg 2 MCR]